MTEAEAANRLMRLAKETAGMLSGAEATDGQGRRRRGWWRLESR
jgi:hypothetical protein